MATYGATFKLVCRQTKGVINHIKIASNERNSDDAIVAEKKREADAQRMKQRWMSSYLMGQTIDIVRCP